MASNRSIHACRQCRAEGAKLFLKGDRCLSSKCPMIKFGEGTNLSKKKGRQSYYGKQLREKQRLKRFYHVSEKQFSQAYHYAASHQGNTGELLFQFLERRLDNVIYRLGLAMSRPQARQLVSHGMFSVNGVKVDIPSYIVKKGDQVAVRESKQKKQIWELNSSRDVSLPAWLEKSDASHASILEMPKREDITDIDVKEQLIVELFSK